MVAFAVRSRRLADLLQVLQGWIEAPDKGANQGEGQQGDHDVQGEQRPAVGLQAQPGVLPIGQGRAGDGLRGGQRRAPGRSPLLSRRSRPSLFQPYPGVDEAVQQIHHDHHEHQKGAVEHRGAHDDGVV